MQEIISQLKRKEYDSVVIYGATASGKSQFALELANELQDALIINADSMQVYKEIPIITAQPNNLNGHLLYGFVSCIDKTFSVAKWLSMVAEVIENRDYIPIIVGGTGMYISSLINGLSQIPTVPDEIIKSITSFYDLYGMEKLRERLAAVDLVTANKFADKQRIIRALSVYEFTSRTISDWQKDNYKYVDASKMMKVWIKPDRDILYERINYRFINMIKDGAIEEAKSVQCIDNLPKAIGLREIIAYIENLIPKEKMITKVQQLTRNYAKRQETWFRNQLPYDYLLENF